MNVKSSRIDRVSSATHRRGDRRLGSDLGLVVAGATLAPATMVAENAVYGPDFLKLGLVAVALMIGGSSAVAIGEKLGLRRRVATMAASLLLVAFTLGGSLFRMGEPWVVVLASAALWIILFLSARWSNHDSFWSWLRNTAWLVVLLVVGRAAFGVIATASAATAEHVIPEIEITVQEGTGSFYLIVLDGYPGSFAELPELAPLVGGFVQRLNDQGFHQVPNARANYNFTYAALSSALSLDHGPDLSQQGFVEALEQIRGNNRLVRQMRGAGYRYVHVESGWSGSTCGKVVDVCYEGPWIDDTVEALADLSVGGIFWKHSASTSGALNALNNVSAHITEDDGRDFVFAHILLPHPPVLLDDECNRSYETFLDTRVLNTPGTTEADLRLIKAAYLEQVECVNNLILGLVDRLPPRWPVLITSDHGTDFRGQTLKVPDQWDEEDIDERFSILTLTRLPARCRIAEANDLVNLMRSAASCVLDIEIASIPPHYQIVPHPDSLDLGGRLLAEAEIGLAGP